MKLYESIKDVLHEEDMKLHETAWRHELKSGKELRRLINDNDDSQESWVKVLNQIKVCCEELKSYLGEDDTFIQDLIDDCDFYIDTIDTEEDSDNIDYCLDKLFNICDDNNIWVPLMDGQQAVQEAANPENAEANALIKQALDSKEFAVEHKKDLEKLGLRVDVSKSNIDGNESIRDVVLTGPNGRKLKSAFSKAWSTSDYEPLKSDYANDTQANYNNYNSETGEYENYVNFDNDFTLDRKTYGESRRQVSGAKEELPRLKKRLSLYAKRYGENSSQYKELKRDIDSKEAIVTRGIQPTWSDNKSNDIDYLNYLNKPFRSSRPKAREVYNRYSVNSEPVDASNDGTEVDKANELSRKYKKAQQYKRINDRQKEDNLRRDKEDEERVQDIIKRNKEEKDRRDFYTAREDERIDKDFSDIQSRLDAYKKRLDKNSK